MSNIKLKRKVIRNNELLANIARYVENYINEYKAYPQIDCNVSVDGLTNYVIKIKIEARRKNDKQKI